MPTIQELGIDCLNVEDRLRLIGEIWDSISIDSASIPESHQRELDRRLDAPEQSVTREAWDAVQASLHAVK